MENNMSAEAQPVPVQRAPQKYAHFHITDDDAPLIARLSKEHRDVLGTVGSYKDIATALSLEVGTVKSRIHRARASLVGLRTCQNKTAAAA